MTCGGCRPSRFGLLFEPNSTKMHHEFIAGYAISQATQSNPSVVSGEGYFLVGNILNVIESTSTRGLLLCQIVVLSHEYQIYQT